MSPTPGTLIWNPNAFIRVRTDPDVMARVDSLAMGIAARAGKGYFARSVYATGGRIRARASVWTTDSASARAEEKNHTLLKAARGG